MTAPRRSVLTFALGGLALALLLKSCGGASSDAEQSAQAFVRSLPALHASLARLRDSAAHASQNAQNAVQEARHEVARVRADMSAQLDSARNTVDSLQVALQQRDTLLVAVGTYEVAFAAEHAAHLTDSTRADAAEVGLRQAELHLRELLAARKCRIALVVPCPSRPLAFLGGAVVGVVGYIMVKR